MGTAIMNALNILTLVMIFGIVIMLLSGREIGKQNRGLHERNQRERERERKRMDNLLPDGDHAHG